MHELVELYSCADLFVNFSVEETFGLTTAESLACGTPVLVYNSTACSEIVTKEIGFIIAPHDIKEASEVVKRIKTIGKIILQLVVRMLSRILRKRKSIKNM